MNVMPRCAWCGHLLWLYQAKSPGKSMHQDCWTHLMLIQSENQSQYQEKQWQLRAQEEDRL
jgi:hypothetical protein